MLTGMREQLVSRRTQLSNTIRGYAAEFGTGGAKGLDKIEPLLARIAQDENVPTLARELFALQGQRVRAAADASCRRSRPGCWPGIAATPAAGVLRRFRASARSAPAELVMKTPDPHAFTLRAATSRPGWGSTPKDHSTAGKTRLGVITRAGDESVAQRDGGRRHRRDQAGDARARSSLALAARACSSASRPSWRPWRSPTRTRVSPGS